MTIVIDPTAGTSAVDVSLDHLVGRVRRELSERDNINILASDLTEGSTTIALEHSLSSITRGTLISIADEVVHAWDNDVSNKTVNVLRGYDDTLATTHTKGALVNIGGTTRKQIVDAINDELMSVSGKGLYQMKSVAIANYSPAKFSYEIAALERSTIYDVQYLAIGTTNEWRHLAGFTFGSNDNVLTLGNYAYYSNTYRVLYRSGFNRLSVGDDDLQLVSGLQSEAADVLVWGACARLTANDEFIRNDFRSQGDTRRPQEVPPGAVGRSSQYFKAIRDERLSEEKDRLRRRFPVRRSGW